MCGIAGMLVLDAAKVKPSTLEKMADAMLCSLQSRGTDATGYAAVTGDGLIRCQRAAVPALRFVASRRPFPSRTEVILLHTRFATQGDPEWPENNHPVRSRDYWAVHNGHVSNDREVFKALPNVERIGEVDSEAIPALIAGVGGFDNLPKAFEQLKGGIACAVVAPRAHPGEVVLVRSNYSPLVVLETRKLVLWASTREAIERAWRVAYGTPPKKGWSYPNEGTILRYRINPPKGQSWRELIRFAPPKTYVTKYYGSASPNAWRDWEDDGVGGWPTGFRAATDPKDKGKPLAIAAPEEAKKGKKEKTPKGDVKVTVIRDGERTSTTLRAQAITEVEADPEEEPLRVCDLCGSVELEVEMVGVAIPGQKGEASCQDCADWAETEGFVVCGIGEVAPWND